MLGLPDRKGIWGYPPINQKTWKAGYRFRGVLGPCEKVFRRCTEGIAEKRSSGSQRYDCLRGNQADWRYLPLG